MKKILSIVVVALVAIVCGGRALAATPLAVWDGDFSSATQGDFTITATNGNTIADTSITIAEGATGGVVFTGPNSSLNNSTFIIKGTGLNLESTLNQYLITVHQNILGGGNGDASYNKVGVSLGANNAGVYGIWENAYYTTCQTSTAVSSGNTLIVNIQVNSGVFVYEVTTSEDGVRSLNTRFSSTNLKASNTNYKGFSLGGVYEKASSTLNPAVGWQIEKIAVFGSSLTEAEMLAYAFPSEIQTIEVVEATNVSSINAQISSGSNVINLNVADGVTLTIDEAFSVADVRLNSTGSITLSAEAQPEAATLAALDVSGVQGSVYRSWLTPGIVGMNFNAAGSRNGTLAGDCRDTSGALASGGIWYANDGNASGTIDIAEDGLTKLTWSCANLYTTATPISNGTFMQGYLDDGGNQAQIAVTGIPYATYDVIVYCATDNSTKSFKAKQVNGVYYKWDDATKTVVSDGVEVTNTWGSANVAVGAAVYGSNAIRINRLTGPLSIVGGTNGNDARGCIAAIQIMPTGEGLSWELTLEENAAADWTTASWTGGSGYPTDAAVTITMNGDATLTLAEGIAVPQMTLVGTGALTLVQNGATIGKIKTAGPTLKLAALTFSDATVVDVPIAPAADATEIVFTVPEGIESTIDGAISGAAKVVKAGAGTLTFAASNTFTGGLEVRAGLVKTTNGTGYGPYTSGAALADLSTITVQSGATVDMAGTADYCYAITIAGTGTAGQGALVNSGNEIGTSSRQTSSLTLSADATIGGTGNFGLLASGYAVTPLTLNGYTLTKVGANTFYFKTTQAQDAGAVVIDEGAIWLSPNGNNHVNLTNVPVTVNENGTLIVDDSAPVGLVVGGSGTVSLKERASIGFAEDNQLTAKVYFANAIEGSFSIPYTGSAPYAVQIYLSDGSTIDASAVAVVENGSISVSTTVVSATRTNPVTGATLTFNHLYTASEESNDWATLANWRYLANSRAYAETGTTAPGATNADTTEPWGALLFDGVTVTGAAEGWNSKYGLFNGAEVTISAQKIQSSGDGQSWIAVDDSSKLTYTQISGGNTQGKTKLYVAAPEGIVFPSDNNLSGANFDYFLAGEGSIKYEGGTAGTHSLSNATFAVGANTGVKKVVSKTLIAFTTTSYGTLSYDAATITATGATATKKTEGEVTATDELGTYTLGVVEGTGLVLTYVGYDQDCVARIGETGYATLAEAIAAAGESDEIVVLKPIDGEVQISKTVAISEQGYYLTGAAFTVAEDTTLTLSFNKPGTENQILHVAGADASTSVVKLVPNGGVGVHQDSTFDTVKVVAVGGNHQLYMKSAMSFTDVNLEVQDSVYIEDSSTITVRTLSGTGTIDGYNGAPTIKVNEASVFEGTCNIALALAGGASITLNAEKTGITTDEGYTLLSKTIEEDKYVYVSVGYVASETVASDLATAIAYIKENYYNKFTNGDEEDAVDATFVKVGELAAAATSTATVSIGSVVVGADEIFALSIGNNAFLNSAKYKIVDGAVYVAAALLAIEEVKVTVNGTDFAVESAGSGALELSSFEAVSPTEIERVGETGTEFNVVRGNSTPLVKFHFTDEVTDYFVTKKTFTDDQGTTTITYGFTTPDEGGLWLYLGYGVALGGKWNNSTYEYTVYAFGVDKKAITLSMSIVDKALVPTTGDGTVVVTGEGENAVAVITPTDGTSSLTVDVPDSYLGKVQVPASVDSVSGVDIDRLLISASVVIDETTYDIGAAFKKTAREDGSIGIELDAEASVTVDGETITVKPVIVDAEGVSIADGAVAVKTIPGLVYRLLAGTDLAAVENVCDLVVGDGSSVQLENGGNGQTKFQPADATAVFFKVTVEK
ncbi:MAG: beta strand repeat-containing protein [Kiritimatiellia bacterium]